jgi:hypothetical protein
MIEFDLHLMLTELWNILNLPESLHDTKHYLLILHARIVNEN